MTTLFTVYPDHRERNYRISELDAAFVNAMTDQVP